MITDLLFEVLTNPTMIPIIVAATNDIIDNSNCNYDSLIKSTGKKTKLSKILSHEFPFSFMFINYTYSKYMLLL